MPVEVAVSEAYSTIILMAGAYDVQIEVMADTGYELFAGSVLKIDFWIRDEQDSLLCLPQGCFDVKVFSVNTTTDALSESPIGELQAFAITEDGQQVPGLYRAVLDTSLAPESYTGGTMFAVLATIPYPTGGSVLAEKTFLLTDPTVISA